MIKISRAQVSAFRLLKNHLEPQARRGDLERVVSDACCIQAQVMSFAELAIWSRVQHVNQTDVKEAIWKHHKLVKTWLMRGTLHLVTSSDFPLYVSALRMKLDPHSPVALPPRRQFSADVPKTISAIKDCLDGKNLSRLELANQVAARLELGKAGRKDFLSGWGAMLHPAAFEGALCFGPSKGQHVSFVRPDHWIGKWRLIAGEKALKELVRRFVATYGPSTHQDFAHWWGWLEADASRNIFQSIMDELEQVDFDGRKSWMLKSDISTIQSVEPERSVRLLPSWDCYVMFYSPRDQFIPDLHRPKLFRQIQGNAPALVVDGLAVGIWEGKRQGNHFAVKVEPFTALDSKIKPLIRNEAERLEEFLGTRVDLSFS